MLLSIVIPVYKVEKYIAGTLSSIYNQGFDESNFEVVVVDDGTPDNSMQVVKLFATMHRNLHVFHQENQGLSAARNAGFLQAKGDFVWWVDSDDQVAPDSLAIVSTTIEQHPGHDIYAFGIDTVREEDGVHKHLDALGNRKGVYNRTVDYSTLSNHTFGPVARYIMNRKFVMDNNLLFWVGILHEDMDHLNRAFFAAKKIWLSQETTYYYLERASGSIMSTVKMRSFDNLLAITKSFMEIRDAHIKDVKAKRFWDAVLWRMTSVMLRPQMRGHGLLREDWETYKEFVAKNKQLFRALAFRGAIVAFLEREWRDAILAIMVQMNPDMLWKKILK